MKNNNLTIVLIIAFKSSILLSLISCNSTSEANVSDQSDVALVSSNLERITEKTIPDLYYGVDTRFAAVKKADVHNATTIYDFLNEGEKAQIEQINSVNITIIKDNELSRIYARGTDAQLTYEQLILLRETDYFSHFTVRTEFKAKNENTGQLEKRFFGPHITVVPEKQATYVDGKEALISYLKANSVNDMNVITDDKLGAIKLSFTISKEGIVTNVKHDAMTTGYPSIDNRFMTLLQNIPGKWIPAENSKGEKMDQELVFTFGPRDGC